MYSWLTPAFLTLALVPLEAKPLPGDSPPLEGSWAVLEMIIDGKALPPEQCRKLKLEFSSNVLRMIGYERDDLPTLYKIHLDAKTTPASIDVTPDVAGSKKLDPILGIYALEGDSLKLVFPAELTVKGRTREFAAPAGSKLVLFRLERGKLQPERDPPR
jgi:uncharacterized protein (TIGR03067 family)